MDLTLRDSFHLEAQLWNRQCEFAKGLLAIENAIDLSEQYWFNMTELHFPLSFVTPSRRAKLFRKFAYFLRGKWCEKEMIFGHIFQIYPQFHNGEDDEELLEESEETDESMEESSRSGNSGYLSSDDGEESGEERERERERERKEDGDGNESMDDLDMPVPFDDGLSTLFLPKLFVQLRRCIGTCLWWIFRKGRLLEPWVEVQVFLCPR